MDEQAPVLGSLESIEVRLRACSRVGLTEPCFLPFSQLVSLFIESFLNGALLFIYAAAAWILLVRNRRPGLIPSYEPLDKREGNARDDDPGEKNPN